MSANEMIQSPQPIALNGKALEEFVVRGNLAALSPADKAAHYIQLCNSLGLNPATKPFEYITLQGKETLYARRDATEQLRKIHDVSLTITGRETVGDIYIVTARAQMPNGRTDESTGVVSIKGEFGDKLANKLMSAETKAKRRVTLSIVGLGMLDESETESIERDRFAAIAPEATPAKVVTIEPKAAPVDELPPVPKTIETLPEWMVAKIKPLQGLAGIPLLKMDADDLELVASTVSTFYEQRKASRKITERGAQWLMATASRARSILAERSGDFPPPPDESDEGNESFTFGGDQ